MSALITCIAQSIDRTIFIITEGLNLSGSWGKILIPLNWHCVLDLGQGTEISELDQVLLLIMVFPSYGESQLHLLLFCHPHPEQIYDPLLEWCLHAPNKSYMKFHGWWYTTYYYCQTLLIHIIFKYRRNSLCNTAEKTFPTNILPSYLPMLCQQSTIRPKDSTCIIELSTILFWNGPFVKVTTENFPPVLLMYFWSNGSNRHCPFSPQWDGH